MSTDKKGQGHRVFLSVPYYQSFIGESVDNHDSPCSSINQVMTVRRGEAFVERNFSELWAMALNSREKTGIDTFGMIHTDVSPDPSKHTYWLDDLLAELDRTEADLLSVVLPIKTMHGLTSTSILSPEGKVRRLTMHEVMNLPVSFDAEKAGFPGCRLLASTGLWVCKFTDEWIEKVWFETHCKIVKDPNGVFIVKSFPEDWFFSNLLHSLGCKVMSTRIIDAVHWGMAPYPNNKPFGSVIRDEWKTM